MYEIPTTSLEQNCILFTESTHVINKLFLFLKARSKFAKKLSKCFSICTEKHLHSKNIDTRNKKLAKVFTILKLKNLV